MAKSIYVVLISLVFQNTSAQGTASLRKNLQEIVAGKKCTVGIAISGENGNDTVSINGDKHLPMQSVFKFHIALAVLSAVDEGHFSLQQPIAITQKDLLPHTWSPLRDAYPNGATLTLAQILEYTVSQSDNNGCDILLRLIGGPEKVEKYFAAIHQKDLSIKVSEEQMASDWNSQFLNWTTPKSAVELLTAFYTGHTLLSKPSFRFLLTIMKATVTGKDRIRGQLPIGTIVAHKTGTSGTDQKTGVTPAVNDIGIVFLPRGRRFFISVFVTDSKETAVTNEKIIAEVSRAAWDYFTGGKK